MISKPGTAYKRERRKKAVAPQCICDKDNVQVNQLGTRVPVQLIDCICVSKPFINVSYHYLSRLPIVFTVAMC